MVFLCAACGDLAGRFAVRNGAPENKNAAPQLWNAAQRFARCPAYFFADFFADAGFAATFAGFFAVAGFFAGFAATFAAVGFFAVGFFFMFGVSFSFPRLYRPHTGTRKAVNYHAQQVRAGLQKS